MAKRDNQGDLNGFLKVPMSTRYGPDETWPSHQKPWWNEALEQARAAGWALHYIDAPHCFGIVSCPSEDEDDRHLFKVDKTAKGGETISKEALKRIRTCQHGSVATGSKVQVRQAECERLLQEAERLIELADEGLTLAESHVYAWAELERVEVQLETAAENLAEVLREEEAEAWRAVEDTDGGPEPEAIANILDEAASAVTSGESVATALKYRKPKLAKPFLDRAQTARTRIGDLRGRLGAL